MVELLFASHNKGKVQEVQALLSQAGVRVFSPVDMNILPSFDVAETGKTFEENSELKARAFAKEAEKCADTLQLEWILADDSGLVVDALNGQPGVHSKRFIEGSDHDRNQKILELLENHSNVAQRTAHFVTVFCLFHRSRQHTHFFKGQVDGYIADAEKGVAGFGYDPLFVPIGYQQTFAELGVETKNVLSHRAKAAEKVIQFFHDHQKKESHD